MDDEIPRGLEVAEWVTRTEARLGMARDYVEAYHRYCWPVHSVNDLKLAPFHLLATEEKCTSTGRTTGTCKRWPGW